MDIILLPVQVVGELEPIITSQLLNQYSKEIKEEKAFLIIKRTINKIIIFS